MVGQTVDNVVVTNGSQLYIKDSTVTGNVIVRDNAAQPVPANSPGLGIVIAANQVGGNLDCAGNSPAPKNLAKPNVARSSLGQCAEL